MGVIINNNDNQSDLQRRITSDLREKQEKRASGAGKKNADSKPDFVKAQTDFVADSSYMRDFAKSSIPGWVWAFGLIVAVVIAALIANAILNSGGSK